MSKMTVQHALYIICMYGISIVARLFFYSLCVKGACLFPLHRTHNEQAIVILPFCFIVVKLPFEAWVTKAESDVKGLLPQASDHEKVGEAKEKLEEIQKVAMAKEKDVSALSELATKFEETRKVNW